MENMRRVQGERKVFRKGTRCAYLQSVFALVRCRKVSSSDNKPLDREFPFRHLNEGDKKWLENRIHDKRSEVAEAAREVYRECFPYAERNAWKKQLVISTLDFEIHTEVYQEYWD